MADEVNTGDDAEFNEQLTNACDNEVAVAAQAENLNEGSVSNQVVCEHCGDINIEDGYIMGLCTNCREKLTKFRLPIWVKGFALIVAVILVAALVKFPSILDTGISCERAVRFEQEKKHMSAMREYEKVVNTYPDSTTALCKLFITQYRAGRIGNAVETYDKLVGREIKDEQLFNEVDGAFNQICTFYFPSEEFNNLINENQNYNLEQTRDKVADYVNKNPQEVFSRLYFTSILMNTGETEKAKEIALSILKEYPDYVDCRFLLGAIYRETREYDKAIELYNNMLENNIERADAYSAIARIELKRGNDKQGLDLALKAYNIDNTDSFIVSNLVLAYHFNNMTAERDKTFDMFKNQGNYNESDYELLTSIINGTNDNWKD